MTRSGLCRAITALTTVGLVMSPAFRSSGMSSNHAGQGGAADLATDLPSGAKHQNLHQRLLRGHANALVQGPSRATCRNSRWYGRGPSFRGVLGCQPSIGLASAMSGQRWTGSSTGNGRRMIFEREPVISTIMLGELGDRGLDRVAEVDRAGDVVGGRHQRDEALDQIVDIAEGAGLAAVAIERDRRALAAPGR